MRIADVLIDGAGSSTTVNAVRLRFTMSAMDMGAIETDTQPVRAGHFRAQGQFFTMAGEWAVEALLLRDGSAPLRVPFSLAIAAPGGSQRPAQPASERCTDRKVNAGLATLSRPNCAVCHDCHW